VADVADRLDTGPAPAGGAGVSSAARRPADPAPRRPRSSGRVLELARGRVGRSTAPSAGQKSHQGAFVGPRAWGPGRADADTTRAPGAPAPCWPPAIWSTTCRRVIGPTTNTWRGWSRRVRRGAPVTLRRAPIDVGPVLAEALWPNVTAVLTSATVPPLARGPPGPTPGHRPPGRGQPLPLRPTCALLYCAAHLPDRRTRRPGRPCTTSSDSDHRRRRDAPWPCSPAGGPWRRPWRRCGPAALPGAGPERPAQAKLLEAFAADQSPVCSPPCRSGRGWTSPGPP
jgi:hypothetical protein